MEAGDSREKANHREHRGTRREKVTEEIQKKGGLLAA